MSEEDKMCKDGILGEDSPEKLRNTVMYLLGLSCALCGGQEHRDLRVPGFDPQVKICQEQGVDYLLYTEDACSKTNQGGLSGRKHVPKTVRVPTGPDFDRNGFAYTRSMLDCFCATAKPVLCTAILWQVIVVLRSSGFLKSLRRFSAGAVFNLQIGVP